jgi:pyrroline-5-carboxylate reductase
LHLSVAAGIRSDSMVGWLGTERIVRAMPNTPALVGRA